MDKALNELARFNVAIITIADDSRTITSRRQRRFLIERELKRKAGTAGAAKRWQKDSRPQWQSDSRMEMAPPASAYAYASSEGIGVQGKGEFSSTLNTNTTQPDWETVQKWRADWLKNGADYTEFETRGAYLALQANGWMWGRNPIIDHRAALERQIQTDRQRNENNVRTNKPGDGKPAAVRGSSPVGGF